MKLLQELIHLCEDYQNSDALIKKLETLKSVKREMMKHAMGPLQNGVKPEWASRVKQINNQIKIVQQEIETAKLAPEITYGQRLNHQRLQDLISSRTPEEKKERFGQAISQGFEIWKNLRTKYNGDVGLDKAIHTAALNQTDQGKYPLDVEQLADSFNVPARSMYKWLERPSMMSTALLMPKNQ